MESLGNDTANSIMTRMRFLSLLGIDIRLDSKSASHSDLAGSYSTTDKAFENVDNVNFSVVLYS